MGPRHKTLRIAGVALAVVLVVAGGMVGYAAYNLTAVIARNQTRIVYRASKALGRPVQIAHIKAAVGLGLAIEVDDLKIADDPAFSREPFLDAAQASFEVEFLPLLKGRVKVQKLELVRPAIRILRRADGQLNVDTLGGSSNPQAAAHGGAKGAASAIIWSIAREVSIKGLGLDDGTIYYSDAALKGVPLQINHLTIEMAGFHSGSPFDLDIKAALFNDQPNLSLSGKMGPMLRQGVLDIGGCPLDLVFKADPIKIDSLRTLLAPGAIIPATLSMPDALTVTGSAKGTLTAFAVAANSGLSGYRIIYRAASNQPGTAPLVLNVSGQSAVNGTLRLESKSGWDFTAALTGIAARFEGAQLPAITDLNGRLHLTPARFELAPTTFLLGSQQAKLEAHADSLSPLRADFAFNADALQVSQIIPSRPPGEFVRIIDVKGSARGDLSAPSVNARIRSASGLIERLAYSNLDLTAIYDGHDRLWAQPLSVNVFDGSVLANVNAVVSDRPPFDASASVKHLNVASLLRWLEVGTTAVSGFLSADARVSGAGTSWKEIEPTLRSSGRVFLSSGELHGVNIVAVALNKIAAAPVVSQLVGVAFRSSHQGLFASSNTDLRQTSMTYTLAGQRVNTNDLLIVSPDYQITGAGWFDFDKNIDMSGDIKLTLGLSAAIPVVVMGRYPALLVLPNIPKLAERTALGVVSAPVNIIKGGANAVGNIFGGIRSVLP